MRLMPAFVLGFSVPLAGAVLLAAPANAAKKEEEAPKQAQLKPSQKLIKPYQEAGKALEAKDFATAQAKITEAEAFATSDDDKYLIGSLYLNLGLGQQNTAIQAKGAEAMLASGKSAPDLAPKLEALLVQVALQGKDFGKAIVLLEKITAAPGAAPEMIYQLGDLYIAKGVEAGGGRATPESTPMMQKGLATFERAAAAYTAAGQPVPPSLYKRATEVSRVIGGADAQKWAMKGIEQGGSPEGWATLLTTYQDGHKTLTRGEQLDVYRLMVATGAASAADYNDYAEAALKSGLAGEVKMAVDTGRSTGKLQAGQLAEVYQIANGQIAADKASLVKAEAAASKAADGKSAASTGSAYYGYGDNAKAVTLFKLALQKGGVDANEVNTRLGIALAKSGDTAGAKAAFGAVTGPGSRKEIADFWLMWLNSKAA